MGPGGSAPVNARRALIALTCSLTLLAASCSSSGTWAELGVSSQPGGALFSAEGEVLTAWRGTIPEADVLALIA